MPDVTLEHIFPATYAQTPQSMLYPDRPSWVGTTGTLGILDVHYGSDERLMGTDCLFVLPQGETREDRLASFYSQECIRYVLNCIYAEAFATDYDRNLKRWQATQQMLDSEEG